MNESRKKKLNALIAEIEAIRAKLDIILNSEQEYYDDLSEKSQEGEKGEESQAAIENMEGASTDLENAITGIESAAA